MERILAQSEVDVFRAVEIVKQNRPQLVTDLVMIFFKNEIHLEVLSSSVYAMYQGKCGKYENY